MYDKLGDLLNEALDSGKIPQEEKKDWKNQDLNSNENKSYDSSLFSFKFENESSENKKASTEDLANSQKTNQKSERIRVKILKKDEIPSAQVIKMHNYATFMHFPPYIQKALNTLDIAYPFTLELIKQKYRNLLKENHPDTKSTIQNSNPVDNNRHLSIDQIKEAYNTLCKYFGIE
ncbi:MAG: DnaJ domain-containing protein [Treponema sp.]|nr:DnaJ domain-containing protein [Treponema sp.]